MKTATIKEIKTELNTCSHQELIELCLQLSRFKKENKELITYILFESTNENEYIIQIKTEIDEQFNMINTSTYYFIKKSVRKILRNVKKHIRYSKNKETEVELLLHFCGKLKHITPSIQNNIVLKNMYHREIMSIQKKVQVLHEDLQYDYTIKIKELLI
ncbi:hypothetical protein [Aquimarina muelleri]|uniref:Uncharacterized protein n=1 Tax=Aquimarina muelleri TaxID=279356 RepID=A0A918JV57_9FLAO|nr:hypothetical protein [Aquimarina muelleri]MCX2761744.1 hypothetical protein [Aquimarina muelleri]GGX15855.1 hypothetical protein GCM10007384_16750 [Aquimarina muelleri]